jgi:hypothetical protein
VPHYSTLSRRQKDLVVTIPYRPRGGPLHLVIDSTGLKVRAVEMTDHRHGDGEILPGSLAQLAQAERIAVISGDGAHDTRGVYEASASRKADLVVPSRRNGRPWRARTTGAGERNETLRAIRHLGRRLWKRWSGYHRRSLAETAISRLRRLGERLSARAPAPQVAEMQIRCVILNTFNRLGMPDTVALA